ncbi:acetylxylan esterase [Vibrio sp. FNV 38]|nr:acetylxylan esterase [Vibrio sp. FNV 38]
MDMPVNFEHSYDFDPTYGYDLEQLKQVAASPVPKDFAQFWRRKYQTALQVDTDLNLQDTGLVTNHWRVFDCYYSSTDKVRIGGWLLLPSSGRVERIIVWVHGYGGLDQPDTRWTLQNTAILMPCLRGISRSAHAPISSDPYWHVLHDIHNKQQYVLGGCVQDIWCGISALLTLYPYLDNQIGFIGSSFGGGLGIFASAFDPRIQRSHFHVPTFGNLQLRLEMPTAGSTQALIDYSDNANLQKTLPYFDASCAAKYLTQPTHWGLALFDPFVAPPGQFSIFNGCKSDKALFILDAGHFSYRDEEKQNAELRQQVEAFMQPLGVIHAS